jgi:hypothetical protein
MMAFVAAGLLDYFIHSTILLGGVYFTSRMMGLRFERIAEIAWRSALFGPIVTSFVQTVLIAQGSSWPPLLGVRALSSSSVAPVLRAGHTLDVSDSRLEIIVGAWAIIAGLRVAQLLRGRYVLRRAVRGRLPAENARMLDCVESIAGGNRVIVALSSAIEVPLVIGTRELCLPLRVTEMPPEEIDAVIAHEIAHIVRRDPFWLNLTSLATRALFIQPLNLVASRRLRAIAEWSCDEWAVLRTGNPVALASALARVSAWVVPFTSRGLEIAMASRESLALVRVRRILEGRFVNARGGSHAAFGFAAAALVATVIFAPGVSAVDAAVDAVAQAYTISAVDDAGPFTVTVERGVVTGFTDGGIALPRTSLVQRGASLHVRDRRGVPFDIRLIPAGGIAWSSRPRLRSTP